MTTFIRLLEAEDKAAALARAVEGERAGAPSAGVFKVSPESFAQVPGSPFAYWVSERIRRLFKVLPPYEKEGRTVRIGMKTGDDFRFLRAIWEVPQTKEGWTPYAKGGVARRFYVDLPVAVNWKDDGEEVKAFVSRRMVEMFGNGNWEFWISNSAFYFRPGLTWPLRASRFSPQVLPAGCIFSVRGYAIIASPNELLYLLGVGASLPFDYLFKVMLGRFGFPEFIVGVLQKLPTPEADESTKVSLGELAKKAWREERGLDSIAETSHAFTLPALLQMRGADFAERIAAWAARVQEGAKRLAGIQSEIDSLCFDLYGFTAEDRAAALGTAESGAEVAEHAEAEDETETEAIATDASGLAADLMGWLIGVAFGRFDARLATGERKPPPEPEPFDPLPVCSPGMLTDQSGLPGKRPPEGYPIAWPEDGILVDDPGMGGVAADRDIVRRARQVIEVVWGEKAGDIERELCALLGIGELRDYLRKPSLFFDAHLKRYSISRRKAPIYWPLSSASGSYTVWAYYPRLTADTLYKIIAEHVGPKISKVEDRIAQLEGEQAKLEGREAARAAKELGELTELLAELKELREELLRVAKLPYKPDLNDGVQITAAPLWRLFRLPRWRAELEKTWKALEHGEYDWAHLAYAIWPDRVKEKCKTDKSLAIARGLEKLYEEPNGGSAKAEARESKAKQTSKKQKRAARGKR